MIRSAKQRRFLEATQAQRGYTAGSTPPVRGATPSPGQVTPEIATPGGAVKSGGFLQGTQFKKFSMLPMRKLK